jgi:predicted nucleotidyltransferase
MCPHPVLFSTITGTHQYGFVSPDGDVDIRGAFTAPPVQILGLDERIKHVDIMTVIDTVEVDGVLFEIERFIRLILKGAGNVLEELFSPVVLADTGCLEELQALIGRCLTRGIVRHYLGFFEACVKKLKRSDTPEIKMALYAVRIALTGAHLLRTGEVQAHLPTLARDAGLDFVDDWIALKKTEHEPVPEGMLPELIERLGPLKSEIKRAVRHSILPKEPKAMTELSQFLVQIRRNSF